MLNWLLDGGLLLIKVGSGAVGEHSSDGITILLTLWPFLGGGGKLCARAGVVSALLVMEMGLA